MSTDKIIYKGANFADMLTILFIYLKMTGQIDWSWWLVLLPLWLPAFINAFVEAIKNHKERDE